MLKKIGTIFCCRACVFKGKDTEKNDTIWKKENMKKLSSKKKILQIRMLNKNIQKMNKRKNKRLKDKKKAAEKERTLPRNR